MRKYILFTLLIGLLISTDIISQDIDAPKPKCLEDVIIPMTNTSITLFAIDFNESSYDNWSNRDQLRYTFTQTPPEEDPSFNAERRSSSKSFSLGVNQSSKQIVVDMYVWDEAGNADHCSLVALLESEIDYTGVVKGRVIYNDDDPFEPEFNILIKSVFNNSIDFDFPFDNGSYEFNNVGTGTHFVSGYSDADVYNGISTLDFVLMLKHILKISQFTDAYAFIAADVSKDDVINTLDLIQLRQVLLGIDDHFPNNHSYRFIDFYPILAITEDILKAGIPEKIFFNMDDNVIDIDFTPIKVGDVNHTFTRNINDDEIFEELVATNPEYADILSQKANVIANRAPLLIDTVYFNVGEVEVNPGDQVCIPIQVQNFNQISGFQFPISWDKDLLQYTGFNSQFNNYYFNENFLAEGELLILWIDPVGIPETMNNEEEVIELCFDVIGDDPQYTSLSFESSHNFEAGVFNLLQALPMVLNGGQLTDSEGCVDYFEIALGIGDLTVQAADLYQNETANDQVLVNGESSIVFTCNDLGEHLLTVSVLKEDGSVDTCYTSVKIVDKIAPVIEVKPEINLLMDDDLQIELDPDIFIIGVYDNCSETSVSVYPSTLDCSSSNPVAVTITVSDPSGNYSSAVSLVHLEYPGHPGNSLTCVDETDIYVPLNQSIEITADLLLQGEITCPAYYQVELFDNENSPDPQNDNFVDESDIGNTYLAIVTDPQNNNSCWSEIHIVESNEVVVFEFPQVLAGHNEEICIPLTVENFNHIGGFQFPIAWDEDVLQLDEIIIAQNSPLNLVVNSNFNALDGELLVVWFDQSLQGVSIEDKGTLFELCFTAIGNYGSQSPLSFYSESGFFQTEIISSSGHLLDYQFLPGEVSIFGVGCVSQVQLELDHFGQATLYADDLYYSEVPGNEVSFDGTETMSFDCANIGSNFVSVNVVHSDGSTENCMVEVLVIDITPPIAIANSIIEVELNDDLEYWLSPSLLDEGSYDICGTVTLSVEPSHLDCNSTSPTLVTLTATDESGNTNQVWTHVYINYPAHPGNSMTCIGELELTLSPNEVVQLSAEMFIEGEMSCPGLYMVTLYDEIPDLPLEDLIIDASDNGQSFSVQISDPKTGLQCWSYLHVNVEDCSEIFDEDKIEWPCDITMNSCEYNVYDLSPQKLLQSGIASACVEPGLNILECHVIGSSYEDTVYEGLDSILVVRQWTIIDWLHYVPGTNIGIYEYEQQIVVHIIISDVPVICDFLAWDSPAGDCESGHSLEDAVEWPADIEVSSSAINPFALDDNPGVNSNNVKPRLFGGCEILSTSYDDELQLETANNTYINRQWTVKDWTNDQEFNFDQLISIETTGFLPSFCAYTIDGNPLSDVYFYDDINSEDEACVELTNLSDTTVIRPAKSGNWLEGLDMMDVITMYKAILGSTELSPYQLIAADINQSGSVTTLDAVLLEMIIQGELEMSGSPWRFVDASFEFPPTGTLNTLLNYPSSVVFGDASLGATFVGVKMGDINNSFQETVFMQNLNISQIFVKDDILFKGNEYQLPFHLKEDMILEGIKIELNYDDNNIELLDISSEVLTELELDKNLFISPGNIRLNYSVSSLDLINESGVELSADQPLFEITYKALDNGILNQQIELQLGSINLLKKQSGNNPELLQIFWDEFVPVDEINRAESYSLTVYPQPANNLVFLNNSFMLTSSEKVEVFNSFGKRVLTDKIDDRKLDVSQLSDGLYLIRLTHNDGLIEQGKLIIAR